MTKNTKDKIDNEVKVWINDFKAYEATILLLCNEGQATDAARCFIYALKIKALIANLNKEDLEINKKVLTEIEEMHNLISKEISEDSESPRL